jgi:hypothetical protein
LAVSSWQPRTLTSLEQELNFRSRAVDALTATTAILAFLHVLGQVCPNPSILAVNDALLLKFSDGGFATLDGCRMMRIFGAFWHLGAWRGNRLHSLTLSYGKRHL